MVKLHGHCVRGDGIRHGTVPASISIELSHTNGSAPSIPVGIRQQPSEGNDFGIGIRPTTNASTMVSITIAEYVMIVTYISEMSFVCPPSGGSVNEL